MVVDGRTVLALSLLASVLTVAAVLDLRTRRIPNALVLAGLVLAFGWQAWAGTGAWSFDPKQPGATGPVGALAGAAAMLLLFLPLNALRVLGAGDVKLMGVVGAFFGATPAAWSHLIEVSLVVFVCGGLLALFVMARTGRAASVVANLARIAGTPSLARPIAAGSGSRPVSPETLPFGVAIAVGVFLFACARALGASWPA